ncbi:hypothetical protein [Nonomuraea sp. SBT364]|uniref:hypothetical protein n=1 Tax=Nonomuraea sp. SBT364 TaxID=1580530 RepID=UPI000AAF4A53|nr:hypothetical protein [Nonomuraea sp. SBT364]
MAKESGLAWSALSIDDSSGTLRDIRNDITNFEFATPRAVQDITGVDKSAMERQLLLADMSMTLNLVFNDAANMSHDVFKTAPSTNVAREFTLTVSGQTLGTTPLCTLLPTDYALTRAADGSLVGQVPLVLANGAIPTWTSA